ncbi:coiled-coil domain-containing protein 151 [Asbolus verrucosus]|uniref:Coiled-coil domain-containing protein 151 n=1 Tax=Asbolus verrucosus TaxID=1661398 RepID=A0A482W883_ASBVE|nr:coiled-coil domain-containing protein 151 [Asbolus verrucosus]
MKEEKDNPGEGASADINKQMLEIKKKIQLSEGQRKAAFEDCEAERKANVEEIHTLKKEIKELVKQLKDTKQDTASLKSLGKKLEAIVGPYDTKTTEEIRGLLDLQIVDRSKALNLVRYKIKKKQSLLAQLGKEYQTLLSQKALKEVAEKVDKPARKATCDLQNSIHAVEVQLREANHIYVRYGDIKKSLQKDSARFESNIKRIEEELEEQNSDINKLQQVMNEATRKRGKARGHLLHEEKIAMATANSRERQATEGKRLVAVRKQELELLEKRIFPTGKLQIRSTATVGTAEDAVPVTDEETPETPSPPEATLTKAFEVLKQATGATNSDEVLQRFSAQKDTFMRLIQLRKKSETQKRQLEKNLEDLNTQLEYFKYAEVKETERKSVKMDQTQNLIEEEEKRSQKAHTVKAIKDKTKETILRALRELHSCITPLFIPRDDALQILKEIDKDLREILEKIKRDNIENAVEENVVTVDGVEEKWLPAPYSGLVRRTPLPQPGASPAPPPPPGSDDEEEVPTRTYLKRQAQLVVDAKSRRKNVRLQPQKRN